MAFDLYSKLDGVVKRFDELQAMMARAGEITPDEFAKHSREYSELEPVVLTIRALQTGRQDLKTAEEILKDPTADADMKEMADAEKQELLAKLPELENKVKFALIPKDEDDERNCILEIRAGTGGDEAALFAADLYRMYQKYCDAKGWRFEILEISDTGIGGFKEASASINGHGVFARMKFESGVHRVQRVPDTEGSGRIHTSAATVAVLPEAEDVDLKIEEKDLRVDIYRSSGAGGQHVNTTDSAIRIVHLPTNITVTCQDERSQHKNKAKAMKILRARIYEVERMKKDMERSASRKSQVGSGDRSERIRTYNYPQGRVTDHRINLTSYNLPAVMEGDLEDFFNALISNAQVEKLAELDE
jgi:peptide chain release factor 1